MWGCVSLSSEQTTSLRVSEGEPLSRASPFAPRSSQGDSHPPAPDAFDSLSQPRFAVQRWFAWQGRGGGEGVAAALTRELLQRVSLDALFSAQ